MGVWVVRAGEHGEQEAGALANNVITIDWCELPDLSQIKTKDELKELYQKKLPKESKRRAGKQVSQIWQFVHEICVGDLACIPLKRPLVAGERKDPCGYGCCCYAVAVGKVVGPYEYKPADLQLPDSVEHIRRVMWLGEPIPKEYIVDFDKDVLSCFGRQGTVYQIKKDDAEERVRRLVNAYPL